MILKNLTRRSGTSQLVNYLFKYEKDKRPEPILKHNLRSKTANGWSKEFDRNFELRINRRIDNIRLHHTIISFSNRDKNLINSELLKDIANKYIELRGKENIYIASSHHDKEHIHLHIVMSSTKYMTGESNRISRQEFKDLKLALDNYQKDKYPELVNSLPIHGKSKNLQLTNPELKLQDTERKLSQKEQIVETVHEMYGRAKSIDNFLSELKSEGYKIYERGGKLYGIEDASERHYRFRTLGIDLSKLEEKDRQTQEEVRKLQELVSLRDSKSQDREQEDQPEREPDYEPIEPKDDPESNDFEDENENMDSEDSGPEEPEDD